MRRTPSGHFSDEDSWMITWRTFAIFTGVALWCYGLVYYSRLMGYDLGDFGVRMTQSPLHAHLMIIVGSIVLAFPSAIITVIVGRILKRLFSK